MTQRSHRIYELTCEQCGEVFAAGRRDKRFCSERCARKSRYDRGKGAALEAARADKACFYCGDRFTPKRSDAVYCSFSCSRKSYYNENREMMRARQRARIQANPEKRQEALARFAERHPDNGKQRYAKLKADPERIAAERARTRQYYLETTKRRPLSVRSGSESASRPRCTTTSTAATGTYSSPNSGASKTAGATSAETR